MPAQDRVRRDQALAAQCSGQPPDKGGEDRSVSQSRCGRGLVRRRTATSCRSTRSSTSLVEDERASNWTSPTACRSRWSRRSDTIMIVPGRRVALITAVRGLRSTYGTRQVRGRAGQFAGSFDAVLADAGIEVVEIPPLCPRANCVAERFVLTIHTERTDRMLIFGKRHLRQVLTGYAAHYNTARPHRALRLQPPRPTSPVPEPVHERIRRRPILDPWRPHR